LRVPRPLGSCSIRQSFINILDRAVGNRRIAFQLLACPTSKLERSMRQQQ
jgi:hypothetical protein